MNIYSIRERETDSERGREDGEKEREEREGERERECYKLYIISIISKSEHPVSGQHRLTSMIRELGVGQDLFGKLQPILVLFLLIAFLQQHAIKSLQQHTDTSLFHC